MKLSIIVPAYREPFLNKTIDSLLKNAVEEIEILPVLDCDIPYEPVMIDPRVKPINLGGNVGMRGAINAGLAKATGEYVMKIDAHCIVDLGFDKKLIDDCAENWLVVPRRFNLNDIKWERTRPINDYHYLVFPEVAPLSYGYSFQVAGWPRKRIDKLEIDDTMTFQGSCWLANRKYFMEHVGFLDDSLETYGTFAHEQQEIGLKYWLGGGAIKINKKTWYAHLFKKGRHYSSRKFSRKHKKDKYHISGNTWGTKHWMNNEEPNMVHSFSWYINKFWPIPTWPDNWQEIWDKHK